MLLLIAGVDYTLRSNFPTVKLGMASMKMFIWLLVATLIIMHQDFWNWNNQNLLWGFLPIGMYYHIGISIAAALVWWFACIFAWPKGIDEFDEEPAENGGKA